MKKNILKLLNVKELSKPEQSIIVGGTSIEIICNDGTGWCIGPGHPPYNPYEMCASHGGLKSHKAIKFDDPQQ